MTSIPHLRIVVAASLLAALGYFAFSVYVIGWLDDPAQRGDIIGTWKSFAVAAFAFWLGSSSGGKTKDSAPATQQVEVMNAPGNPVPTMEGDKP